MKQRAERKQKTRGGLLAEMPPRLFTPGKYSQSVFPGLPSAAQKMPRTTISRI